MSAKKKTAEKLNPFQRAAVELYCHGEFAHLVESTKKEMYADKHGDTLLTFVLRELEDGGREDASNRLQTAIDELQALRDDIEDAFCSSCDERRDSGEGYNGECGTCADITAAAAEKGGDR